MSLTLQKRAEILDRVRDGKKVRFNWLTTVCQINAAVVLEIADEFKLRIEDDYIFMPKDKLLVEKIELEIEKAEREELINYLKQPSYLEHELPVDVIEEIEEIFKAEGFSFKRYNRRTRTKDIIKISKSGIKVTRNNNEILCDITWEDMKDIHLTRTQEKDFAIKKDFKTEFLYRAMGALYNERLVSRAEFHSFLISNVPEPTNTIQMKVVEEIKTINSALISFRNRDDLLINTIDFKPMTKLPITKEFDSLIYIIEHFFHTFKRKEYQIE